MFPCTCHLLSPAWVSLSSHFGSPGTALCPHASLQIIHWRFWVSVDCFSRDLWLRQHLWRGVEELPGDLAKIIEMGTGGSPCGALERAVQGRRHSGVCESLYGNRPVRQDQRRDKGQPENDNKRSPWAVQGHLLKIHFPQNLRDKVPRSQLADGNRAKTKTREVTPMRLLQPFLIESSITFQQIKILFLFQQINILNREKTIKAGRNSSGFHKQGDVVPAIPERISVQVDRKRFPWLCESGCLRELVQCC